uniref:Uncharacterized protein n=1 Tax=Glossina pallidipes TaxID=7398 RepID=A0A1A9ZE30_GLOPL
MLDETLLLANRAPVATYSNTSLYGSLFVTTDQFIIIHVPAICLISVRRNSQKILLSGARKKDSLAEAKAANFTTRDQSLCYQEVFDLYLPLADDNFAFDLYVSVAPGIQTYFVSAVTTFYLNHKAWGLSKRNRDSKLYLRQCVFWGRVSKAYRVNRTPRAKPKSANFKTPCLVIRTLAAFISRCNI